MPDIFRCFDRIRFILENDYAGYADKQDNEGWKVAQRLMYDRLYVQNSPEDLYRAAGLLVHSYKDRALRLFRVQDGVPLESSPGFRVRRYGDALYVTRVNAGLGLPLRVGDCITHLDKLPLESWQRSASHFTYSRCQAAERWEPYMLYRKSCTAMRGELREDMPLRAFYQPFTRQEPQFSMLDKDTAYLRLPDFADEASIEALLLTHGTALLAAKRRIFDLRENQGGAAAAFLPLLPYVLREPMQLSSLLDHSYISYYTAGNCDRQIALLESLSPDTEAERAEIAVEIAGYREKRGRGFLREEDETLLAMDQWVMPAGEVAQVILLTDMDCEGAGEEFVLAAKRAGACLVGRNTMGASDYCNCIEVLLPFNLLLRYPMSKNARVATGEGVDGLGLTPDIHIPWSPEHLERDLDLQKALEL